MAKWANAEEWAGMMNGERCVICRDGRPWSIIAELETTWLVMGDEEPGPPLPGTCALFHQRHVTDLHELQPEEACAFMRDVMRVSAALKEASGAVKINYEVHGNTIPHLHMHFFPRQVGDPFEDGPIEPRMKGNAETHPRHVEIRRQMIEALNPQGAPVSVGS
jgi:diadenosine tetraphosphate (Ap4A) HIT family hydrolase